jgi:hypothetical protein
VQKSVFQHIAQRFVIANFTDKVVSCYLFLFIVNFIDNATHAGAGPLPSVLHLLPLVYQRQPGPQAFSAEKGEKVR